MEVPSVDEVEELRERVTTLERTLEAIQVHFRVRVEETRNGWGEGSVYRVVLR